MKTRKQIVDIIFLAKQEVELNSQIEILNQMINQIKYRIKGLKEGLVKNKELQERNYELSKTTQKVMR